MVKTDKKTDYKTLLVQIDKDSGIMTVTLNRPEKKNAMSFAMMHELIAVAKSIDKDKRVRAVILTGAGGSFCSGIDLGDLNQPKNQAFALWELIKPCQSLFQRACLVWRDVPVPVIVAMQDYCLGAGLQLALAADIRVSHSNCQFAVMEAKWGLVPDMGLTQAAYGIVRADILKELAMTARILPAEQAHKLGLISHIDDEPMQYATQLATELATRSPDAVLASKRVVNKMYAQSPITLYQEKLWQIKLMLGNNRKLALKKVKDASVSYGKRQFR